MRTIMEISETLIDDDRLGILEKRVRDIDAQIRKLIVELVDLKKVAVTLSPQVMEPGGQETEQEMFVAGTPALPSGAVPSDGSTMNHPMRESGQDTQAEPAMVRIMQSDGTMKMEPRYGDQNTS